MPHPATFALREDTGPGLPPDAQPAPELAVLVPTRNEAPNIEELLRRVSAAVAGIPAEIVFVDDSDDDTPVVIAALAGRQDPPEVIPDLLAAAEQDRADLVIASRYCGQGRADGLGPVRARISTACGSAARLLFPLRLGGVTDPMSGFFLVRRSAVDLDALRPRGFKILLELLVRGPGLRTTEVGYAFASRSAGESKGSLREGLTYARSLGALRLGRAPWRA